MTQPLKATQRLQTQGFMARSIDKGLHNYQGGRFAVEAIKLEYDRPLIPNQKNEGEPVKVIDLYSNFLESSRVGVREVSGWYKAG